MIWIRRGNSSARSAASEPDSSDDVATLRADLSTLRSYVNRNSGRIPVESVVTAHCVGDALCEILEIADSRSVDIHTVVSVKGFLNDYLPTTLQAFLAVNSLHSSGARTSARSPVELLREQLEALLEGASAMLAAARTQDADAMAVQGSFLHAKFSRSDLEL